MASYQYYNETKLNEMMPFEDLLYCLFRRISVSFLMKVPLSFLRFCHSRIQRFRKQLTEGLLILFQHFPVLSDSNQQTGTEHLQ